MDFTSLTAAKSVSGSIRRWVNHTDVDSDAVLEDAQALIFQTLRVREMRSEFTPIVMAIGASSSALPTGFLDPLGLWDLTNNVKLKLRTEEWIGDKRQYDSTPAITSGTPYNYAIFGEALQFDLAYDAAATLKLIGFKAPTVLSIGSPTNFLTTRFPHILRSACLGRAYNYRNNDERADKEFALLAAYIQKANAESDLTYRGLAAENEVA
jgi:hypothetical protein